jgi:hypothetical protein
MVMQGESSSPVGTAVGAWAQVAADSNVVQLRPSGLQRQHRHLAQMVMTSTTSFASQPQVRWRGRVTDSPLDLPMTPPTSRLMRIRRTVLRADVNT